MTCEPMTLPFAGVVAERPYPPTGLTTARWASEVPVREVELRRLWLTQPHVITLALFGVTNRTSDIFPHVVGWDGELYLEDGHNRLVRRALTCDVTSAFCRVFEHPGDRLVISR